MTDISDTLSARKKTYGEYKDVAKVSQGLQSVFQAHPKWAGLPLDMKESLQLICNKIARIVNGDCEHVDSWHDIAGYATLVVDRLRGAPAPAPAPLAVPPPGVDVMFDPDEDVFPGQPWRARLNGGFGGFWHRAATRDDAVAAALRG